MKVSPQSQQQSECVVWTYNLENKTKQKVAESSNLRCRFDSFAADAQIVIVFQD